MQDYNVSDVSKTKFLRPRPRRNNKTETKTTGSKQRHLADLTFKYKRTPLLISTGDVPRAQ